MFKSLLNTLTDFAQSRLLGIIRNRKRLLVDSLPAAELDTTEQTSDASPSHHQAAH